MASPPLRALPAWANTIVRARRQPAAGCHPRSTRCSPDGILDLQQDLGEAVGKACIGLG